MSHVWSKLVNSDSSCNFSLIKCHANVKAQNEKIILIYN